MDPKCFVLYDKETLDIVSVSPEPFEDSADSHEVHEVLFKDIHPYVMSDNERYTYFDYVDKIWALGTIRSIATIEALNNYSRAQGTGFIRDLDYRCFFFDCFNIDFETNEKGIILKFDLLSVDQKKQKQFEMSVTDNNGLSTLYVTNYNRTTELLDKFVFDLSKFKKEKEITIPYNSKERISLWAVRNQ